MTNEETLTQEIIDYLNEAPIVKTYSIPKTMVPLEYINPIKVLNKYVLDYSPSFHRIYDNASSFNKIAEFRIAGDSEVLIFKIRKELLGTEE